MNLLLTCTAALSTLALIAAVALAEPPPMPAPMTREQDHQNMLDQLHITALRPGAKNKLHEPNSQNTDESKATLYTNLPDPLILKNGKKVTSPKIWWDQRRPQIAEDFEREVYGRVPKNVPKVTWTITKTTQETDGQVPVITKHLVGHVDNSAYPALSVDIQLSLTTPAAAAGPVPVIMAISLPSSPDGMETEPTWQQQCLARGYGYAVLVPTSFQADNGAGLTQGIIGLCNHGQPRKPEDWGTLRAWAWGADRALDYFATDKAVDARQVGIEGLSRYGKAALVTMAYDQRFAAGFIASSGAGGAKLWRRSFGETEGNIASAAEYHWMAGSFLKYAGPLTPGDLPVDSHELIALCAPRPVFVSCGAATLEGTWLDARGMFLAAVYAGPVYRLLGKKDLGTTQMPPMETGLTTGELAFRQHSGGHTAGPNWPAFLDFAGRYLKSPGVKSAKALSVPPA